ncbi:hypothetical protein [Gulosibacter molinativorax]|uniref:Integral membrane protein n=1 Tax=Gulosibacter molinativorax TaxID=256821 RepID=A0ABT7C3L6_9MICO|nr:hypothetical protein [Gulosibacter molinativorax]MDJ1369845.1 hypothetical protein [Gulosibacter molinativorax]QUY61810.1 Putative integral membrane protein [Gulosibacter molinativorax]
MPTKTDVQTEPKTGASRILVAVYIVLFLAATGRSIVQIARDFDAAPLAYSLSLVAAVVYLVAGISLALAHRSNTWRTVAWIALTFELVGVLAVGVLSGTHPELFPADTVWSGFGRGYVYIPFVLPLLGISYLESMRTSRGKAVVA